MSIYKMYDLDAKVVATQLHGLLVVDWKFFKKLGKRHGAKLEKGDTLILESGKDKLTVETWD